MGSSSHVLSIWEKIRIMLLVPKVKSFPFLSFLKMILSKFNKDHYNKLVYELIFMKSSK